MARVVTLAAGDAAVRRRAAGSEPLYRQVCTAIEQLALATGLADDAPLPPEGELMARYGVSRGTLRRAVEDLVAEGLLRVEAGRGTFVVRATQVRMLVSAQLRNVAVPDSRFGLDLGRFIPDFEGRARCDDRVRDFAPYRTARTVFIAPDNSLAGLRRDALDAGKRVLVPTFAMQRGIVALDPAEVGPGNTALAATLDGLEQCGTRLDLAALREIGAVDLVLTGAIALTVTGSHFGPGNGFLDFEWGLLRHCAMVTPATPVVAVAHACQVLSEPVRRRPHDLVVDTVVTPEQLISCPALPKPDGILWDEILARPAPAGPYLEELLQEYPGLTPRTRSPGRNLEQS